MNEKKLSMDIYWEKKQTFWTESRGSEVIRWTTLCDQDYTTQL